MSALALRLFPLIFLITIVQARILTLNSYDDHLISDGIHHVKKQEPMPNNCNHQYGFLPCAENSAGYIFQILVYQGLLIYGEKQLGSGAEALLHIIGVKYHGGLIFHILMALPPMVFMLVSGVFSSKENAQSKVSLGVGTYVGTTVFSLTLQWGICVVFGKTDLKGKSKEDASNSNCLKDTGVLINEKTGQTAGIMLLSLIPYVVVQLVIGIFKTSFENRVLNLITLIVSLLSLMAHLIFQILRPWMQEISLQYQQQKTVRTGLLQYVQSLGELVNEEGKLNEDFIKKLFEMIDNDADGSITKGELKNWVTDIVEEGDLEFDEEYNVDEERAVKEVMHKFDFNRDSSIDFDEFKKGWSNWNNESKQSPKNSNSDSTDTFRKLEGLFKEERTEDGYVPKKIDKIMSRILMHAEKVILKPKSLVTHRKPHEENIKKLFKKFDTGRDGSISKSDLKDLIRKEKINFGEFQPDDVVEELFKKFDKESNDTIGKQEFINEMTYWLKKATRIVNRPDRTKNPPDRTKITDEFDKIVWSKKGKKYAFMKSLFQISLGIIILNFMGGPLMGSLRQLSSDMGLSSFSISFVIVPLAMNARVLLNAIHQSKQGGVKTASLTFSEIYNGVLMNNVAGLTTLLAIVYAKDLTWDFSAEVLTILVVCAVMGILACSRHNYPLWTCIPAFFLYPFSLGLFYFVQVFLNWK